MTKLFTNGEETDHMPHSAVIDMGLQCLTITLFYTPV